MNDDDLRPSFCQPQGSTHFRPIVIEGIKVQHPKSKSEIQILNQNSKLKVCNPKFRSPGLFVSTQNAQGLKSNSRSCS